MECASDTGTIRSSDRLENNTHYTLHHIYDLRKKAAINGLEADPNGVPLPGKKRKTCV